ncbi:MULTISPECIES: hypothetical protein [Paenibacillus]|uniref:hypothetical protein n=1 Tax=Paenibacillus TaxID=44249 RepID=UPI0007EA84B3|nr:MULTISPECIES: hypothetical protein [Paenibacillus]AZH30247.1 hypothetical protein EGM68_16490 [Paenibacillus sp. M-152]OAZ50287.1 hypothetical protein A9Z39_10140 [Paenibacillus polymyxa]
MFQNEYYFSKAVDKNNSACLKDAVEVIDKLLYTDSKWKLFFLRAIMGGFRRGELIALDEDDCDFENSRLRIDESISSTKNGQADITDTKNKAPNDYVDMP